MKPLAADFLMISLQPALSIYAYVILPVEVIFIKLVLCRVAYFGNKGGVSQPGKVVATHCGKKRGLGVDGHTGLGQPANAKNGNLGSRSANVGA